MQEMFDIDHAEAAKLTSQEVRTRYGVEHELSQSAREPKLIIGRFGCIAGHHTVPHAEHISPSCGAACCAFLEGRRL